ncbi:hypothetical protein GCM10009527_027480 [Actinomadura nitritigenes]|uniref:ABC transporter permease n=1 Tax=Actinomadura nitritigenes TaxID=134602 RepID=A0ABS3RD07_9ACTN|nr:FtsX-like permease family protein [Actinomadura nitritigenes]MBO2443975.1 ABC transporter permease [Actinomadura nitritigenes]
MTLTAERPPLDGPANGGVAARRAVVRWAWRLLRRGWRQQIVVTTLLALAVFGAVVGGSAAVDLTPRADARYGNADHLVRLDGTDPRALADAVALARRKLGTIEVIGRRFVPVPGSVESLEVRAADPRGVYGAPLLAVDQGRLPRGPGETALTDGAAGMLGLHIGGTLTAGGEDRTVVGIVENPRDLRDEFALVPPAGAAAPQSVTVLAKVSPETFDAYRQASRTPLVTDTLRGGGQAAAGVLAVATVLLMLVSLVAAAAFAVIAQRRLRQIGMLAAIGATQRQLRLVMLANGAAVGAIAAAAGTLAGVLAWMPVSGTLETAAEHRISPLSPSWSLILECAVLAVVMATAAAWWPARTVARVPVVQALSDRPPRPKASHRPALLAVLFLAAGVTCLALADQTSPPLIVLGTFCTVLGILFAGPPAIKMLALLGARAPIAVRLALRDLARHRSRSAAALAAVSLALGIPVAVIVSTAAAQDTAATGNLSDRQMLVRIGQRGDAVVPIRSARELADLSAQMNLIAGRLGGARVIPLEMAADPAIKPEPGFEDAQGGQPVADLGIPTGGSSSDQGGGEDGGRADGALRSVPLYLANPQLLAYLHVDPAKIDPRTDVITTQTGRLEIPSVSKPEVLENVQRVKGTAYTSDPDSVLTTAGLDRRHWKRVPAGWLIESGRPLTADQRVAARHIAAEAGVTIESRRDQRSLGRIRLGAALAGMLLALGVLAMTVGLIRIEAARDLRTLTATGASGRVRRTITAATAGALALLGVVLGSLGAYAGLLAGYSSDIGRLSQVPVLYLIGVAAGVPLVAAGAGWLFAGREPPAISGRALE